MFIPYDGISSSDGGLYRPSNHLEKEVIDFIFLLLQFVIGYILIQQVCTSLHTLLSACLIARLFMIVFLNKREQPELLVNALGKVLL